MLQALKQENDRLRAELDGFSVVRDEMDRERRTRAAVVNLTDKCAQLKLMGHWLLRWKFRTEHMAIMLSLKSQALRCNVLNRNEDREVEKMLVSVFYSWFDVAFVSKANSLQVRACSLATAVSGQA